MCTFGVNRLSDTFMHDICGGVKWTAGVSADGFSQILGKARIVIKFMHIHDHTCMF